MAGCCCCCCVSVSAPPQWWQAEDAALWALLAHALELVRPPSVGEAAVRARAGEVRRRRRHRHTRYWVAVGANT
jgi:hypothetical protein